MFEPFKDILDRHGHNFAQHLAAIKAGIGVIASNTQAQLVRNQFSRKSTPVAAKETAQLRNDSAYGWLIKWAASTVNVQIFIGNSQDESFLLELEENDSERVEWYVPVGGVVFITNLAEATDGFTNFEVEVLVAEAAQGHTGGNDEHVEIERREPVPSGTPLDTPTVP